MDPATVMVMTQPGLMAPVWIVSLLHLLEWIVVGYTGYVTILPLAGFVTRRETRRFPPQKRFAIVIPAHNERVVIGNLVDCCLAMDYPRELFDVVVVADNCTDDTAAVAERHGARVIERTNPRRRGKGYALADAFQRLTVTQAYDAVVVFDADNLVDPGFLRVMNAELIAGRHVIQGRIDVKNPDDTWVAATFGMSFWTSNRFWFLAKHNLGLSAALGGTGMCISTQALREVGWDPSSLTEDLEFSAKALLCGYKTYWSHDAAIYDEKPLTFAQSWRQRLRWAQGQAQVASHYLPRLIWAGIREGNLLKLEGGLALFQPFYVILSTGVFGVGVLLAHFWSIPLIQLGVPFWVGMAVANYVMPAAAMVCDRRPARPVRFLILYPLFMYSWIPLTWGGVIRARNREWAHTAHTRAIAYAELVGGKGAG
jgi:cellulose synthase/poly-beta-1,6-N-acetylglucosamine synthase-like glycosyltransferase